jgi:primosomal replication protein N
MKTLIAFTLVVSCLLASENLFSQNISNVIGIGGTYTIKNAATNYFTVSQSTGHVKIFNSLRLETTTGSGVGVLYMGADRFLHNFGFGCTNAGINSGNFNISSLFNTAVGQLTLFSNSNGSANAAFGYLTMGFNLSGTGNSAFGYSSLFFNSTGSYNSAFGSASLLNNTSGMYNSAFGDSSLVFNSTGDSNCAFGSQSLYSNTTGSQNSAFGRQSMFSNTTGSFNTAIGHISGFNITTGSNLTCIGYASQPSTGSALNQFTLGNNTLQSLRCNVTSITSLSDRRDKKKIKDLTLGIDFLMKLKPRLYNWDKREWYENGISDGTKMQEMPTAGFIAQELDEAQTSAGAEWLNLVLKDNSEKWEATTGNLLPVIVKAVQELKAENEELKSENDALISENTEY